ncbi:MAG: S8 family serine peptidase [Candidatus Omnitrophota bacterium]
MKNKIRILMVIGLGFALSGLSLSDCLGASDTAKAGINASEYVPQEVLVKFAENVKPELALKQVNLPAKEIKRVFSIEAAIGKFKKTSKLEKDSDGWYWFLGKNYKEIEAIPSAEMFQAAYENMDAQEKGLFRIYNIKLPENISVEKAVGLLSSQLEVEYAEPNYIGKPCFVPDSPYFKASNTWGQGYEDFWNLKKLQCEDAWDISQGEGVAVAVIDGGVDYNHPDLKGNMWVNEKEKNGQAGFDDDGNGYVDDIYGYDFSDDNAETMDQHGHGTHVAGIIAANGGIVGVAPKAKIMALRAWGGKKGGISSFLNSIYYAVNNGARVINCSWTLYGQNNCLTDAFHYAHDKGVVCVAAAGNDYSNVRENAPANIDTVIAVAATNQDDKKCDFSNFGEKIDFAAPGGDSNVFMHSTEDYIMKGVDGDRINIISLRLSNSDYIFGWPNSPYERGDAFFPTRRGESSRYYRLSGTSMSSPHAAAVAALLISKSLSKNYTMHPDVVRKIMRITCDKLGIPGLGYGRINAYQAVNLDLDLSFAPPQQGGFVRDILDIRGSAYLGESIRGDYKIFYSPKSSSEKRELTTGTASIKDGILGKWNTKAVGSDGKYITPDGEYILTLETYPVGLEVVRCSINVTVDNLNDAPQFTSANSKVAVIGRRLQFKVEAKDNDDPKGPYGGKLEYWAANLPRNADFNPQTQIFTWAPSENDKGVYSLIFNVTDGRHSEAQEFTLSTLYIEETQITNDINYQGKPSIYEDKIVWQDKRYDGGDIYLYDLSLPLSQRHQERLTFGGIQESPFIQGDKIVWQDNRAGSYEIYMYDFIKPEGQREIQITKNNSYKRQPRIYGDKIIWQDNRNDNMDIYLYDAALLASERLFRLTTNSKKQISGSIYDKLSGSIYEDKIVWQDWRDEGGHSWGDSNIYLYDFTKKQESPLITDSSYQLNPVIYKDKVVWEDSRNANSDIYLYDLTKKEEIQVTPNFSNQLSPDIYEDIIVWADYRYGEPSIYMYDLTKRQEIRISDSPAGQSHPKIYGNRIVWQDERNGNSDIYLAELFYAPKIISVSFDSLGNEQTVTIQGENFGYEQGNNSRVISLDGRILTVQSWADAKIICKVSNGVSLSSVRSTATVNCQAISVKVSTAGGESNGSCSGGNISIVAGMIRGGVPSEPPRWPKVAPVDGADPRRQASVSVPSTPTTPQSSPVQGLDPVRSNIIVNPPSSPAPVLISPAVPQQFPSVGLDVRRNSTSPREVSSLPANRIKQINRTATIVITKPVKQIEPVKKPQLIKPAIQRKEVAQSFLSRLIEKIRLLFYSYKNK